MPVIGLIDIPDNLWDALIEIAAKDFAEMTFDIARRELVLL